MKLYQCMEKTTNTKTQKVMLLLNYPILQKITYKNKWDIIIKVEIKLFQHFLIISKIHRYQIITIKLTLLHTIIQKSFIDPRIKRFENTYLAHLDKQYDDIYILSSQSGEVYCFLAFCFDKYIKNNKSKKPVFLATKSYHIQLIQALCPEIPHIFVDIQKCKIPTSYYLCYTNSFRVFTILPGIFFNKLLNFNKQHPQNLINYFCFIVSQLKIPLNEICPRKVCIPQQSEKSMLQKCAKINLNLKNFILLIPKANSMQLIGDEFWLKLMAQLTQKGYEVFVNQANENLLSGWGAVYKTCDLDFLEIFALAKKAKHIVGLRCGLLEFLTQTQTPMSILYNHMPIITYNAEAALKFCSIAQYSALWHIADSQITEIIYDISRMEHILTQILRDIQSNPKEQP